MTRKTALVLVVLFLCGGITYAQYPIYQDHIFVVNVPDEETDEIIAKLEIFNGTPTTQRVDATYYPGSLGKTHASIIQHTFYVPYGATTVPFSEIGCPPGEWGIYIHTDWVTYKWDLSVSVYKSDVLIGTQFSLRLWEEDFYQTLFALDNTGAPLQTIVCLNTDYKNRSVELHYFERNSYLYKIGYRLGQLMLTLDMAHIGHNEADRIIIYGTGNGVICASVFGTYYPQYKLWNIAEGIPHEFE